MQKEYLNFILRATFDLLAEAAKTLGVVSIVEPDQDGVNKGKKRPRDQEFLAPEKPLKMDKKVRFSSDLFAPTIQNRSDQGKRVLEI